jgi:Protein of unknown function (DUF3307)
VLFWLLVGHAVADFPLQNGPMAVEKCRHSVSELQKSVPWYYWLTAHALMHGGFVALFANSLVLGIAETIVHWLIDFGKCENWFGIHVDQGLHVACKVIWYALVLYGIPPQIDMPSQVWAR